MCSHSLTKYVPSIHFVSLYFSLPLGPPPPHLFFWSLPRRSSVSFNEGTFFPVSGHCQILMAQISREKGQWQVSRKEYKATKAYKDVVPVIDPCSSPLGTSSGK